MQGKHKGNNNSYTDQRDEELAEAFSRAKEYLLRTKGYITLSSAVNIARMSPCSRFFVSEERASKIIRRMIKHEQGKCPDPLADMIDQRRRMFSHIYIIYKRLRDNHPQFKHPDLVVLACAHPAQEFYLTSNSAKTILGRIILNSRRNGVRSCNRNL